ncbi:hypothetical protein FKM82_030504 [Ascaphus truei]
MEEEEDEEKTKCKYTWRQATEFIQKFVEFAECNSHYNATEVMNLHIIQNSFYQKKAASIKQADLRDMFKRASQKVFSTPVTTTPLTSATPDSIIVSDAVLRYANGFFFG